MRFAQTIAGMEITVVVRASVRVPSPLHVDVVAHGPGRGGRLDLALRSVEGGGASSGSVRVEAGRPGMYPVVLSVARVGPHELELRAGAERSVLPFTVLVPRAPLWEVVVYAAFACAAVALLGALVSAAMSRRVVATCFGGGFAVAVVVAFTTGLLSSWFGPPVPEGAPAADAPLGRPNAQPVIEVLPERPARRSEFVLRVELYDGSTGRPADDLVEHHAALTHMVVTSQDGAYFRHVHPTRTGPGTYEVRLRAEEAGRHLVYAEFERADAGGQLVSGAFTVGEPRGSASVAEPARPAAGPGPPVTVPARPVAGRPVRITLDAGTADLQPWLGMAGHLIVRSQDGGYLGHIHEAGSMAAENPPDESVARFGPRLEFTFSFPRPGRYLAWIQYARNYEIVTVPHLIEVTAETSPR
ncbi:hypothetical protein ETD86_23430 [Nonomuraea turkmeniaca]|uniref:Secreted protein n=1 Tax=Nonomuraea turkmeniaca TaxID=103838 RepID=A0A5S4FEV9_9ACTN|nr:hypothetical protein ETD86_23430 [Nonomuraea turkmeniaca]